MSRPEFNLGMSQIEINYLIYTAVLMGSYVIAVIFWNRSIQRQNKEILRIYALYDTLIDYCLKHILKQAVEEEDYETARRCKEMIDYQANKSKSKPS